MRRAVFLSACFLFPGSIYAQSFPAINFYSAQELLPPAGNIILVERQPDGSFNELVVDSKLNRTVPSIKNSVAGCLPAPSHGGARQNVNFNPTGTASQDGAVADLNGNGIPELVVAINPPEITVYYDLDRTKPFHYRPGIEPAGVSVGDVNGDGKPDLAVANFSTAGEGGSVSVLLGNGDGAFQSAVNYPLSSPGSSVAIADFNGDGKPDLAVAMGVSRSIMILLGDGTGGFGAATSFPSGGDSAYVAVGDFNGDGKLDLAQLDASQQVVPNPIDLDPSTDSVYLLLFGTGFRHALSAADVTVSVGGAPVQVIGIAAQGQIRRARPDQRPASYSLKGSGDVAVKAAVAGQPANIVRVNIK